MNLAEPLGEAWLTGTDCRVANGPFTGKSLAAAWQQMPVEWRGENFVHTPAFPLLLKFIFPMDKLSIQVHPNDEYASVHEQAAGGRGKTEMWHAVSANPGATLLAGLKSGTTREIFRQAVNSHKNLEEFFQSHEVHSGDTFFIPAGTPHTIGPNMVIFEVQEYSDLTYRIYDYDRIDVHGKPRELHIQKALEVMNFDNSTKNKTAPLPLSSPVGQKSLLCACKYFATERWSFDKVIASPSHLTHFDLIVIFSGSGTLEAAGSSFAYNPGECWLIPAALGMFEFRPATPTTLIRTYVPKLFSLAKQLFHFNFTEDQVAQVLFELN